MALFCLACAPGDSFVIVDVEDCAGFALGSATTVDVTEDGQVIGHARLRVTGPPEGTLSIELPPGRSVDGRAFSLVFRAADGSAVAYAEVVIQPDADTLACLAPDG